MQFSDKNIFQMFVANGGSGFWVQRTTWPATIARVVKVGAFDGPPPYYGSPSVLIDVYDLDGGLKDSAVKMPVPGTYKTWRLVEPPTWADTIQLRPLNDPALDENLAKLDKKRRKDPPDERTVLSVPFERKDEAKRIGARWASNDKVWWLPTKNKEAIAKAMELGFLGLSFPYPQ